LSGVAATIYLFNVKMADHPNKLWLMPAGATTMLLAYAMYYGYEFRRTDEKRAAKQKATLETYVEQWQKQLDADIAASKNPLVIAYDRSQLGHYCKALGRANAAISLYGEAYSVYASEVGNHPVARNFYQEYAQLLRDALRLDEAEQV